MAPDPQSAPVSTPLAPRDLSLIISGAMIAIFLAALDQTIVATALPSIVRDLGDVASLSWVVTAYLVTSICATAIAGKLSDVYGRRRLMLAALVIFIAASILCALAQSMTGLIAARALKGIGGGALMTLAQTVIADVVSPRERGRYAAHFSGMWALASLLGPTLGGLITEYLSWHWIFWMNLPLGLVALVTVDGVLRKLPVRRTASRIDAPSMILLPVATTAALLALSWGGVTYAWVSLQVGGALILAIVVGWSFWRRQLRLDEPIFAPAFLHDAVVGRVLPAMFFAFATYLALAVTMPVFLKLVLQLSPGDIGLLMIPFTFSTTITAYLAGRYVRRTGDYRRPPLLGFPLAIFGALGFALLASHVGAWATGILLLIIGLGVGPMFPISVVAVQNAVKIRDIGAVTGALGYVRSLGGAVGAAAAMALVLTLVAGSGQIHGLDDLMRIRLGDADRLLVAGAFRWLFLALACALGLAMAAYSRVELRPLREHPALTDHPHR